MSSRISMLEGIRAALAKSDLFEDLYNHLQPSPQEAKPPAQAVSRSELVDRFATELAAVGGEVHRTASAKLAVEMIRAILADIEAKSVAISDLGLFDEIPLSDVDVIAAPSREDLFAVDAGICTAQFAIAETGTLVLRSTKERHRLVSLVPPVHICVLKAVDIRPSMLDVLEELSNNVDPAITFITGPSRTSDIELTLAIGVHGPKRLIVVLID